MLRAEILDGMQLASDLTGRSWVMPPERALPLISGIQAEWGLSDALLAQAFRALEEPEGHAKLSINALKMAVCAVIARGLISARARRAQVTLGHCGKLQALQPELQRATEYGKSSRAKQVWESLNMAINSRDELSEHRLAKALCSLMSSAHEQPVPAGLPWWPSNTDARSASIPLLPSPEPVACSLPDLVDTAGVCVCVDPSRHSEAVPDTAGLCASVEMAKRQREARRCTI